MDLSKYNVAKAAQIGSFMHLRNPFDGELLYEGEDKKVPFGITVLGRDAKSVQEVHRITSEAVAEGTMTPDEQGLRCLAAAISGWSESMKLHGEPLPYTPDNACLLLSDEATEWVGEQLLPFSLGRRNFGKNVLGG